MRHPLRSFLALLFTAMTAPVGAQAPPSDAAARLHALFDREWEWELSESPLLASGLGDLRWNDKWDDISPAALERRQHHREAVLEEVKAIDRAELSSIDRTHLDVFRYQYEMTVEGFKHRYYLIRTDTYAGVQNSEQLVDTLRFATRKDYDDWLARLEGFPTYVDQNVALMREGMRANVLLPKVIARRVLDQVITLATQPPRESGFYKPFIHFPESVADHERAGLEALALDRVRARVQPAFAQLRDFIEKEYLPACYDQIGWSQTSSGAAGYAYLARLYTTTDLTPQQIHELGSKEVARIHDEMERIKTSTGFTGALPQFFAFLRSDPRFFYKTPAELLEGYRALAKRVDPELIKVIGTLPRLPYGVRPIPDAVAPNTTAAYANQGAPDGSRPAYFFVNLYRPEMRPKWEMLALTLHEAIPGHCLQASRAFELRDLPAFRRYAGFTAYVEGWALYSESLGEDMGLYDDDPYSRFGRLTYEMWRAVRLVVDTGIHVMHWDRDRAIKYFMDNAAKTELDVTNEIDRYISWPGQALAYKVGELKIKELRNRARSRLGARFDLRAFNDRVLETGPVPLQVLDAQVEAWIAAGGPALVAKAPRAR
jgi:uncharacterized protein (DUF885 family)